MMQPPDQAFLKSNGMLKLVPEEHMAAAQKAQLGDMASGGPPRPLLDTLRAAGHLSPDAETALRDHMEGRGPAPPGSDLAEGSWIKSPLSIFEMAPKPAVEPAPAVEIDLPSDLPESVQGMDPARELELAQKAVRLGYIREAQLRECLAAQLEEHVTSVRLKARPEASPPPEKPRRSLLVILVERGCLSRTQLEELLSRPG